MDIPGILGLVYLIVLSISLCPLGDADTPSFSPVVPINVCPGETAIFICTVIDSTPATGNTFWTGTAFDCDQNRILLVNTDFESGTNGSCNSGAVVAQSVGVDGDRYISNLTVTLSPPLDGTTVDCLTVGNYTLTVLGSPPSAPTNMNVVVDSQQYFVIQWSGAIVGGRVIVNGYNVDISGPDDGCGDRSVRQFTATEPYQYQCSMPSVGETYIFSVSGMCGTLEGPAEVANVTLQVPSAPQLKVTPVYNQSTGDLLRIESQLSTLPPITLAETSTGFTLDEGPSRYLFTYSDGTAPQIQTVESGNCTGGQCRDVFTVPSVGVPSGYEVAVAAENRVGIGQSSPSQASNTTNNFLEVEVDVVRSIALCRFLDGFTGIAECQIEYSTQEDLSDSVVDTGSSTSGDTITVDLTVTLDESTTYYYLVTASAEGASVRIQGLFRTNCLVRELVSDLGDIDSTINGTCPEDFVGSVRIPAGRACFNGTAPGSIAMYSCECEEQYTLVLPDFGQVCQINRVCQNNGTWSGTIPDFERVTFELGRGLGIAAAVILYVPLLIIALITVAVLIRKGQVKVWHCVTLVLAVAPVLLPSISLFLELLVWFNDKEQNRSSLKKIVCISTFFIIGNIFWFASAVILIVAAATFTQANGECSSVALFIVGLALSIVTVPWFLLICLPMLLYCVYKRNPLYEVNASEEKTNDVELDKTEGASAEEQPNEIPNISDPNYSHFEGGQQEYTQLPPVPPHVVADYSQQQQDSPTLEESSGVNQGPPQSSNKQTSTTV